MTVSGKDKIKVRKPDFKYDKLENSSERYYIKEQYRLGKGFKKRDERGGFKSEEVF